MAILFLSISYVSLCQWLPYDHLTFVCQWLPYGHLTFVYVSDSQMATLRFSVSDSHMATLHLSISVTPIWSPYVCLCQWLPYGHLTFVYVSDSQILHLFVLVHDSQTDISFFHDAQMDTLYSSISMTPEWTPYFVYYQWLHNGHLMFFFISDPEGSSVDPRPSARKFLCSTKIRI
jgi:hypothetical protein